MCHRCKLQITVTDIHKYVDSSDRSIHQSHHCDVLTCLTETYTNLWTCLTENIHQSMDWSDRHMHQSHHWKLTDPCHLTIHKFVLIAKSVCICTHVCTSCVRPPTMYLPLGLSASLSVRQSVCLTLSLSLYLSISSSSNRSFSLPVSPSLTVPLPHTASLA